MPDHSPLALSETATGDLTTTSPTVFVPELASAVYLVLEVAAQPATAGNQNDSAGGERLFDWGWLILGVAEFGAYRETFTGRGTRFPCIIDLSEIHLDFLGHHISPGYTITWRTLA